MDKPKPKAKRRPRTPKPPTKTPTESKRTPVEAGSADLTDAQSAEDELWKVRLRGPIGRPLVCPNPSKMQVLAQDYFTLCRTAGEPITVTGLALHVGLSGRQSLIEYGRRPAFAAVVEWAKGLVEFGYERRLEEPKPGGPIFALKNFGWSDQREVHIRGALAHIDVGRLSDEQIARAIAGESLLTVLQGGEDAQPIAPPQPSPQSATEVHSLPPGREPSRT